MNYLCPKCGGNLIVDRSKINPKWFMATCHKCRWAIPGRTKPSAVKHYKLYAEDAKKDELNRALQSNAHTKG